MGWDKPKKDAVKEWKVFAIIIRTSEQGRCFTSAGNSEKIGKQNQQNLEVESRFFVFWVFFNLCGGKEGKYIIP